VNEKAGDSGDGVPADCCLLEKPIGLGNHLYREAVASMPVGRLTNRFMLWSVGNAGGELNRDQTGAVHKNQGSRPS
jgi:hypothetical protein